MALTGDPLVAVATTGDVQDANGTLTATSYTATLAAGGVALGGTFVAPPSGVVLIHFSFESNNTGGYTFGAPQVRTGGVVGSGTVFFAAADNRATFHNTNIMLDRTVRITGLTPGNTYNWQILHKVSAGTGTVGKKEGTLEPQP